MLSGGACKREAGWLPCDSSSISLSASPEIFDLIPSVVPYILKIRPSDNQLARSLFYCVQHPSSKFWGLFNQLRYIYLSFRLF